MAQFILPNRQTKKLRQFNLGHWFGDLWASFNLDLWTNRGEIGVSRRMAVITNDTDDAQLGYPTALIRSSADATDRFWALCDTVLFKTAGTDPTATYTQDAIGSSPTTLDYRYSDMEDWEGDIIVSRSGNLDRLSGGVWTASWWTGTLLQTALTSSIFVPVKKIFNGLLLIGDDRYVHTIRKNDQGTFIVNYKRLILPAGYRVRWIRSTSGYAWIGANHIRSGEAAVFYWDGQAENYNSPSPFGLNHSTTLCGVIKEDLPYTVNGLGQLLKFTGSGFREVARFPVVDSGIVDDGAVGGTFQLNWDDSTTPLAMIHPNGIDVVNDQIHMLVNTRIDGAAGSLSITLMLENFLGGVWTYDGADEEGEMGSLIHRYSLSQTKSGDTQVDYGIEAINIAGFLKATFASSDFVCGAGIWTDNATTERKAIFSRIALPAGNRGYFITSRFPVSEVEDLWSKVITKFRKLDDSDDRIIIKYRIDEDATLSFRKGITWTSTTTFTTTNSASDATDMTNVADGDEVEVLLGNNAGATVHVSGTPTVVGNVYTVTIDEAVAIGSGTARVRFRGWTKLRTISSQSIRNQFDTIGKDSQWIQFKIEMRADMNSGSRGVSIEEMIVESKSSKRVN